MSPTWYALLIASHIVNSDNNYIINKRTMSKGKEEHPQQEEEEYVDILGAAEQPAT